VIQKHKVKRFFSPPFFNKRTVGLTSRCTCRE